ncbi:hypothetical protein FACS1894172_01070 [Spirochaetia bacterium]|nr:hypothetical protein FACS1894164_06750 [Spirochaetia bacterium]GHU29605.1 hypothetical protein FACS1894172_01070 [Spirochaetia bacterium]
MDKAIETLAQDWKISFEEALILFEGIIDLFDKSKFVARN